MDQAAPRREPAGESRGWLRATALLAVALSMSVVHTSVLVALPFIALVSVLGMRRLVTVPAVMLATVIVVAGPRDALWYVERAWALLLGGGFVALTLWRPTSVFSARALGAVLGSVLVGAALLGTGAGAWEAVDWAVTDRMLSGVAAVLDALSLLREGALPPALVATVYETAELQATIFPAQLGLASLAGVGVAWWAYVRLAEGHDGALAPLRGFRFNDHLVWMFIAGLVLVVTRWSEGLARVGSNAVVFMGALYALRGAAVVVFISGGLSLLSYVLLGFALLFVPPVVVGAALVVGVGDTWLRFRERVEALPG